MSAAPAALVLTAIAWFLAAPVGAQTAPTGSAVLDRTPLDTAADGLRAARAPPLPQDVDRLARDAYKLKIARLYQVTRAIHDQQIEKLGRDTQLLEQFKTQFHSAKSAIAPGNHDLATLADNVQVGRAAVDKSAETLAWYRQILAHL